MSWWDKGNLSNFASAAIKNAQRKIDTVLDINPEPVKVSKTIKSSSKKSEKNADFWSAWLSPADKDTTSNITSSASASGEKVKKSYSSWSSWGFGADITENDDNIAENETISDAIASPLINEPSRSSHVNIAQTTSFNSPSVSGLDDSCILTGHTLDSSDLELLASHNSPVQHEVAPSAPMDTAVERPEISDVSEIANETCNSDCTYNTLMLQSPDQDKSYTDIFDVRSKLEIDFSGFDELHNDVTEQAVADVTNAAIEAVDVVHEVSGQTAGQTCRDLIDSMSIDDSDTFISDSSPYDESGSAVEGMDKNITVKNNYSAMETENTDSSAIDRLEFTSHGDELSFNSGSPQTSLPDVVLLSRNPLINESNLCNRTQVILSNSSFINDSDGIAVMDRPSRVCDTLETLEPNVPRHSSVIEKETISDIKTHVDNCDSTLSTKLGHDISNVNSNQSTVNDSSYIDLTDSPTYVVQEESFCDLSKLNKSEDGGICDDGGLESLHIDCSVQNELTNQDLYQQISPDVLCIDKVSIEHLDTVTPNQDRNESLSTTESTYLDSSADTCESIDTVLAPNIAPSDPNADRPETHCQNIAYEETIYEPGKTSPSSSSGSSFDNILKDSSQSSSKNCELSSQSTSDKYDCVRSEAPSDIDTTASSDIEIISTPATNNDDGDNGLDLSPLKISLTSACVSKSQCHHRREDSSGSSCYSHLDQYSPERYTPEREEGLLKIGDNSNYVDALLKKVTEMTEVIQARELKLVQLSKENHDLIETNSFLKSQLQQVETLREMEMIDVNSLTEEFTQRLGTSDKKVAQLTKEKESLLKQLDLAKEEIVARKESHQAAYQTLLEEKDEEIEELRAEGEKLSKQQLHANNILKKLRSKEKDNEVATQSLRKKIEDLTKENDGLKKNIGSKDDVEQKLNDLLDASNSAIVKYERDLLEFKGELEESREKCRSLQSTLDSSFKEIAELHKTNAAMNSETQKAALSAELAAQGELKSALQREQVKNRRYCDELTAQIEDLRMTISRQELDHGRREDSMRAEITYLQQRLQEDENRNQELTQSVTSATRPLLRQIENLQANFAAQSETWDKVERNLSDRLTDSQTQLSVMTEKERISSENLIATNVQMATLNTQVSALRQEKSQLSAKLDVYRAKVESFEDTKARDMSQWDYERENFMQELSDLKREKATLENRLHLASTNVEIEQKKNTFLMEKLKEKETELAHRPSTPISVSAQDSYHSDIQTPVPGWTPDLLEHSLISYSPNGTKFNVYESVRNAGAASVVEGLTAKVKQQEGEIGHLQLEVMNLERTRESLSRELVKTTTHNDELTKSVSAAEALTETIKGLEHRNAALLQMFGEKVEEVQELRMDLSDVKDLYRAQIDQLTKVNTY